MWVAADGWDELRVVVRGGEGWVAKMVCGLLWWLCCGLWWWLDCGLQWVAKKVVVHHSSLQWIPWGRGIEDLFLLLSHPCLYTLLYSLHYCILFCPYTIIEICLKRQEKRRVFVIVMGNPQSFLVFKKAFIIKEWRMVGLLNSINK